MKLPCETVVWYLVPVIKSELAKELSGRGMTQKRIAEVIGVTQAAVSQYLSKKRGSGLKINAQMRKEVKTFADKVVNGGVTDKQLQKLLCKECMMARKSGIVEDLCA